jgi:hypothetical protein
MNEMEEEMWTNEDYDEKFSPWHFIVRNRRWLTTPEKYFHIDGRTLEMLVTYLRQYSDYTEEVTEGRTIHSAKGVRIMITPSPTLEGYHRFHILSWSLTQGADLFLFE